MTYVGIKCHVSTLFKKLLYKAVYGNRFSFSTFTCRNDFQVNLCEHGKLTVGKGCFFNNSCSINCMNNIVIGDYSIFGENVKLYDHNYHLSDFDTLVVKQGHSVGSIAIGKNCWIGSNVIILKDVSIGDNCVIGAGCVIDKSIPSGTIVKMNRELIIIERKKN